VPGGSEAHIVASDWLAFSAQVRRERLSGRTRGAVLDQTAYRGNIPVAVSFHPLQVEGSTGDQRDHCTATVVHTFAIVGITGVASGGIERAARLGESSEEIRETELLMLEDPDRYSRESRMENLDLSVEIHRNSEDVGVLGYLRSPA